MESTYDTFLEGKIEVQEDVGFEVDLTDLCPTLFHHQTVTVQWALRKGRALIAKSFGLGKTRDQVEIAKQIVQHTGGKFLVVCPLGVKHQFQEEDGPALDTNWEYVRTDAEIEMTDCPFLITNYERVRDGDIDPRKHTFAGVSLDEGSVLRSLGSKTYDVFETLFADTPYRFVCTATPSPNNYKEIIYYARWLGIMDVGQALTRWFKRDSTQAGNLTIHPHHEREFWLWVASWALFIYKPSDVDGDDTGYDLPELNVHWHRVGVDHSLAWEQMDNRGQRRLLLNAANGVREASAEKRRTLEARLQRASDILQNNNPDKHWLIWHHLEAEREAIETAVPGIVTVYGSQTLEEREKRIIDFTHGRYPILGTKPEIAGSGCNFQRHCHSNIFLGIDYKFQDFIQAIHRTHRFGQKHPVDVHIIYAESEDDIVSALQRKWQQHNELSERMQQIVKRYGLNHEAMRRDLKRTIGVARHVQSGQRFTAVNNDCVRELPNIGNNSVGLILTSIPFGNHYEYTVQLEDFGHNPTDGDFWTQMDYLIPELLRVLKPGRVAAIHVKDRVLYGHQTPSGFMEISPFSDECVMAFRKHGWLYEGRRTIVTDVVRENASTYRLGWSEMSRDASKMGSGLPEYLLLFRKPPSDNTTARADEPVSKDKADYSRGRWQVDAHSLWRSSGNRLLLPDEAASMIPDQVAAMWQVEQLNTPYNHERHVALCEALDNRGHLPASFMLLPPKTTKDEADLVWDDVVFMRTLNSNQSQKRRENHICPLPLDIVERAIRLYSNEGDLVLDMFSGLFTVVYCSVIMGRRGYGIELNPDYFHHGVGYCRDAEREALTPTLFDYIAANAHGGPNGHTR